MVLQAPPDTRQMADNRNVMGFEVVRIAHTGKHEQMGGPDGAGTKNYLLGSDCAVALRLTAVLNGNGLGPRKLDSPHEAISLDVQVPPIDCRAQIRNRGAAADTVSDSCLRDVNAMLRAAVVIIRIT